MFGFSCVDPAKDVSSIQSASSTTSGHAEKRNLRWIGHDDLQGRSAYQPTLHTQGGRTIAYVGHHTGQMLNSLNGVNEWNGTSILDVTDPRRPRYLYHLPGPTGGSAEAGGAQMVRVCDGDTLPSAVKGKVYMLRSFGNTAHEIWDTTNPASPTFVTTVVDGLSNTHKNYWECETGIAYLVTGASATAAKPDGWKGQQHLRIFDLSNPAAPKYIRDYGLVGMSPASTQPVPAGAAIHGPISVPSKNRIYMAWGVNSNGIVTIVDRSKLLPPPWGTATYGNPAAPTDAEILAAQVSRVDMSPDQGAHTTYPIFGIPVPAFANNSKGQTRDILATISEQYIPRCQETPKVGFLLDITNEAKPWSISTMSVDERTGNFCDRGARFGSHSTPESFYAPYYGKILFLSYFNAGTRVFDIRDPFHPVEVGYFVPPANQYTVQTCFPGNPNDCKVNVMTNNIELDDRGLAYAVDRAGTGMDILGLSGAAANIVGTRTNDFHDQFGEDD